MRSKWFTLSYAFLIAFVVCFSCNTREREAAELLLQAGSLLQHGDWTELEEVLDRVISDYPGTEAAQKATEMRAQMVERANSIAETTLKSALAASIAYTLSYPDDLLDVGRIREFGFERTRGVEIEFVRNEASNFLITAQHVVGDTMFSVGRDGVISAEYE